MINHVMTDKELELVLELLENESKRIAVEARRTSSAALRKEIRNRLRTVDRLVERFREMKSGVLSA